MCILVKNKAARDYRRRLLAVMTIYIASIAFTVHVTHRHHLAGAVAWAVAILPALPILGVLVVVGMYFSEEKDEYERMVLVQVMLWATGFTLATLTVWGFLEIFAAAQHFQTYLAFPMFWGFVALASPFVRRRYR